MSLNAIQHLSNLFDDQEITSEKLMIYRSSQPLSLGSKLQSNKSLGFKNQIIDNTQAVSQLKPALFNSLSSNELLAKKNDKESYVIQAPMFNRDRCFESEKENIKPSGLNSCVKRDIKDAKNSIPKQYPQSRKIPLDINKCTPVWYQTEGLIGDNLLHGCSKMAALNGRNTQPLVEVTNTGTDPVYFEEETDVNAKTYIEKSMDTEDLIETTNQAIETDRQFYEEKLTDTTGLVDTQDKNIETGDEFIQKEKEEFALKRLKSYSEEISSRLSLIQFQMNDLKDEHPKLKKQVFNIFENGENWSDFIHKRFQDFLTTKDKNKKEKILTLKSDLASAKEELNQVKMEVTDIIEKTKEEMAQSLQIHLETKLKQMHQASNTYKASILNTNKFNEFMISENYSVSTESNFCSPSKPMAGNIMDQSFDSQLYLEPTKYNKKDPKKVNKAIMDGMLHLLQNGVIKDSITDVDGMTQAMEELLKTKSKEKLTTDIVFENLMDKTRKKQVNFTELADKKERRRSTRNKDAAPSKKIHVEENKKYPPVIMMIDLSKKV